jgi:hypothetical protein
MAPYGFQVTKQLTFRNSPELFSNVYHYDVDPIGPTWDAIADAVVAAERPIYPFAVSYKQVRVYGPTNGSKVDNVTQLIKDLTGSGSHATTGGLMYPELAYYVSMYVGRNPATGRKRFLRKWLHTTKRLSGSGAVVDADLIDTTTRDMLENWFETMKNISVDGFSYPICTPQGDHLPLNTQAKAGDRLHIRQLKQ